MNEPALIREILTNTKTIAVIGLTNREGRPSLEVSRFLQAHGYRILPVNPAIESALGEPAFPTLEAAVAGAGVAIDLVDVFRAPEFLPAIVDDVIRLHLPRLWLQEGVVDQEAARRAEQAGVKVVMDRCMYKEYMAHKMSSSADSL